MVTWLLVAFSGTLLFGVAGAIWGPWTRVKDCLLILLPAVTGLLGTTVGFYFGSRERR